MGSIMMGVNLV